MLRLNHFNFFFPSFYTALRLSEGLIELFSRINSSKPRKQKGWLAKFTYSYEREKETRDTSSIASPLVYLKGNRVNTRSTNYLVQIMESRLKYLSILKCVCSTSSNIVVPWGQIGYPRYFHKLLHQVT